MDCRPGCGACCIAPSISPSIPALPDGKPAGAVCPHLTADIRCALFGTPERPQTCIGLRPGPEMCGDSAEQAMATLITWERLTAPRAKS
jgi:Fe-S-cluster containining protein